MICAAGGGVLLSEVAVQERDGSVRGARQLARVSKGVHGDVREEEGQITIDSDDADIVNADDNNAMNSSKGGEASVELIYDPVLACYFDPKSGKYYEIQQ